MKGGKPKGGIGAKRRRGKGGVMRMGEGVPPGEWSFLWRVLAFFGLLGLVLFGAAGRLSWGRGWLFLGANLVLMVAAVVYVGRANPELFEARRRIQPGTRRWDRILLVFLFSAYAAIYILAALDDGRFGWSRLGWGGVAVGYALYAAGFVLTTWAEAVNRFFEAGVRIQTERGHHVIDTGPYAVVRHPGYAGAWLLFAGSALSLGSLWALIPAGLAGALLIVRIVGEERMLREELPGYKEYAQRVRFRLIPGVW
jgi:protein-S-isoprenylcysteine O-methyltransferase Ste14